MIRMHGTTTLAEVLDELSNDYRVLTVKDLDRHIYKFHHESLVAGYVSRKTPIDDLPIYEYHGRYGNGFIIYLPNYKSTRYCRARYYIKEVESNDC